MKGGGGGGGKGLGEGVNGRICGESITHNSMLFRYDITGKVGQTI